MTSCHAAHRSKHVCRSRARVVSRAYQPNRSGRMGAAIAIPPTNVSSVSSLARLAMRCSCDEVEDCIGSSGVPSARRTGRPAEAMSAATTSQQASQGPGPSGAPTKSVRAKASTASPPNEAAIGQTTARRWVSGSFKPSATKSAREAAYTTPQMITERGCPMALTGQSTAHTQRADLPRTVKLRRGDVRADAASQG